MIPGIKNLIEIYCMLYEIITCNQFLPNIQYTYTNNAIIAIKYAGKINNYISINIYYIYSVFKSL